MPDTDIRIVPHGTVRVERAVALVRDRLAGAQS